MKKLLQGFTIILFVATISNLAVAFTGNLQLKSNENVIDENRTVAGFSGVSSAGSYSIFITMGNTESLRLEGKAADLNEIETKVENGILKISKKKSLKTFW